MVRDLINQTKTGTDPLYCVRVTANDGALGDQHLRAFQDNEKTIPTILTTSQKLSTGVDARNIRNIVLLRPVNSMIEFKQIIGRGTRLYDGKDHFSIYDFVRAHQHFSDPEWDGPPEEVTPPRPRPPPGEGQPPGPEPEPPELGEGGDDGEGGGGSEPVTKIMVKLAEGRALTIRFIATTTYWAPDGRPISAAEFLTRLFGDLKGMVADEDQLRTTWSNPDNREQFLTQLDDHGYDPDRLDDIRRLVDAPKSDLYDVLSYILFANPPKTRHDRAETVRQDGMGDFAEEMKELLLGILKAYEAAGEAELAGKKLGQFLTARYGSVSEGKAKLGELQTIRDAFNRMQADLYSG